jgi:hypothetical protein
MIAPMKRIQLPIALACLASPPLVVAQALSLFDTSQGQEAQVQGPRPSFVVSAQGAAPQFALRSTSRFGDEYLAVLVDGAGNPIDVRWRSGQQVALPQQPGYAVVNVSASALTLQQPADQPCQPDDARGIRCLDAQTALLSLATLSPVQPAVVPGREGLMGPQPAISTNDADVVLDSAGNAVFVNPFSGAVMAPDVPTPEQLQARAQRAQTRAQRLQQFPVERIADDQVPPGMRLVRTPFGDRLVPIRE